jgi:purine nucleosidase/non-specific riboncleoside hydrolase
MDNTDNHSQLRFTGWFASACVGATLLLPAVARADYKAFAQALVQHDRKRHIRNGQGDCFFFIDPLAAAVVVEPGMVTRSLRASVEVSLAAGITRGMTVVDPSGRLETPMVTLVEEVRLDRLAALYAASVAYSRPSKPV